jgi:5'-nucleotidase
MTLGKAVAVAKRGENILAVDGLPVDCVYLAGNGLFPKVPDIVVSGINHGANLGSDVIFSGTVAAARQAALQGTTGIASSLVEGDDFSVAARMTVDIALSLGRGFQKPLLLNLNFPKGEPSEIQFAALGARHYPRMITVRGRAENGEPAYQLGGPAVEDALIPGTDGFFINQGMASATLLTTDQGDIAKMCDPAYALAGIQPFLRETVHQ